MRWNENEVQPQKKPKEEKKEPRTLAGSKDFDYDSLSTKQKPMLGGNSFGGS